MRRHYIDNIRSIVILLLFPVHTFMIWNDFGMKFYVWQGESRVLSTVITLINPWFMPVMFVLAGMSARYALEKRTSREFIAGRAEKLLIPFVFGMVLSVPLQTLFARKFFDGYDGGLLAHWKYFFTHYTDLSGYDGAFTPGHLWFILFLFVISAVSLPVFYFIPYKKSKKRIKKLPMWGVLLLFIPVWLMYYIGNFGGFSLGKDFALFLVGHYVLSNGSVLEKIVKNLKWLTLLWTFGIAAQAVLYFNYAYYGDLWVNFIGWVSILVFIAFAKRFLNKETVVTRYFRSASYSIYILHQTILVVLAYYIVGLCDSFAVQLFVILFASFILTVAAYHLVKLAPAIRKAIGLK